MVHSWSLYEKEEIPGLLLVLAMAHVQTMTIKDIVVAVLNTA